MKDKEERLLKILKDPKLFERITITELDKKIVGEVASRKVIFLSACGRLLKNSQIASFNLLVNDDAGVGKDYVVEKTLQIIPKGDYIHKTRISPAVFTYWHNKKVEPDWTWDGKVFYPEDISENVLNSEVFKVMCSSGSEAIIVVNQKPIDLEIEGKPVMITTTASATPNPELTRRFSILDLDSSENQTKLVMKRWSKYKEKGIVPEYEQDIIDCQKLLERVKVKIPYAKHIDKHFPSKNVVMRTLYPRFLDYISASTGLYQFQRKKEKDFVLAEGQDYEIARECFMKLCSNKYMIPLTINQKKILKYFEDDPHMRGSITQLHGTMSFLSDRALAYNLRLLVQYGILEITQEKDSMNRDIDIFSICRSYNPLDKFKIPTYKEICRNTSVSTTSTTPSLSSTSSLSPKKDTEDTEDTEASKGGIRSKLTHKIDEDYQK